MATRLPFRARIAQAILGTKLKEFIPSLASQDPFIGGMGGGRLNSYTSKPDQLSANIGWCFTANNAIAEPTAAVELKLYKRKGKGTGRQGKALEEVSDHEILELIDTPNLAQTGEQLRQLHFTYMNFVGESYLYMRDGANHFEPRLGKLPNAIDILPAHRVTFMLGKTYTGSTVKYANDDYPAMSFIRDLNPDPNNPYFGRSIIAASASVIDMERQMVEWNRRKFANGVQPSLVFKTDEPMDDDTHERWKQQFSDENAGTENAHRPLLIEGGDVSPFIVNNTDLQFLDSRKFSMTEILAMWRVSPGLVGMIEDANRANLQTAMYQHALINVLPRIRQFVRQVNASLIKPYDPLFELDFVNPVPEDEKANLDYAKTANGGMAWLMVDEVRDLYGLTPLPEDLGQHVYLPGTSASMTDVADGTVRPQPVAPAPAPPADPPKKSLASSVSAREPIQRKTGDEAVPIPLPAAPTPETRKKELTPEQRQTTGNNKVIAYRARSDQYEQQMIVALRAQFDVQRQQILANLDPTRITKSYRKKDYLDDLTDWDALTDAMRRAVQPILFSLISETGKAAMGALDFDPSMFDPATTAILNYNQARATKIAQDVNDETEKQLRAALSKGVADGQSVDELRAVVEDVMGSASTMRADRIARTEVSRAQGYGDIQAWSQSGVVEGKEWYTAEDEHVCPFCDDLDGRVVGLDENFFDKGETQTVDGVDRDGSPKVFSQVLSYDDVPSCPLHPSCRCSLLPVRG